MNKYEVAARRFKDYPAAVSFAVERANKLGHKQTIMHKVDGLPWYVLENVSPGSSRKVDVRNAAL